MPRGRQETSERVPLAGAVRALEDCAPERRGLEKRLLQRGVEDLDGDGVRGELERLGGTGQVHRFADMPRVLGRHLAARVHEPFGKLGFPGCSSKLELVVPKREMSEFMQDEEVSVTIAK